MMYNEACEAHKMNVHHVTLRKCVEEIRPGRSKKRGSTSKAKETRERYERPRR